jgi:hypothetical protein
MTDLYSTSHPRFPAPSLQVTASSGIGSVSKRPWSWPCAPMPPPRFSTRRWRRHAARTQRACSAVVFGTDTTTAPSTSPLAECTRLGEALAEAGLEYAVHRSGPDPAEQILGLADEHDAALIVMSTKRRSPVVKLLLGSSAQQVILEAECPVLLVK